uniref:Pyridoxamine 5'-phosphate oxidase family protein n=1 Tax=Desulfacinum infernum TaxID=35837 RepID=A0A832A207_9BACT
MRREYCQETDPAVMEALLRHGTIGRLGTMGRDGYPYITPVNYVFWNGHIYFHSAPQGEKIENIRRDNRVCFEVDFPLAYVDLAYRPQDGPCRLHQLYRCVIVRGRARFVEEAAEKAAALSALVAAHEKEGSPPPVAPDFAGVTACAVIEITPERISAKSDLWQNKSLEERKALASYLLQRNRPGDEETAQALSRTERTSP